MICWQSLVNQQYPYPKPLSCARIFVIKINATMGKLHFWYSLSIENFGLKKYFSDVCQFSHSDEECKVWNYMKENNSKSILLSSVTFRLHPYWKHWFSFGNMTRVSKHFIFPNDKVCGLSLTSFLVKSLKQLYKKLVK